MKKIIILVIMIFVAYKVYNNLQEKSEYNNRSHISGKPRTTHNTGGDKNKYNRADWGRWTDEGGNGLNTKEELFAKKSITKPTISKGKVISGLWRDEYTGKYFTNPNYLNIDHIVPLYNAHHSGGRNWSKTKKNKFFNDKDNLIIVSIKANSDKGHKSPVEWLPPNEEYRAEYIIKWYRVKKKWGLEIEYGVSNWVYKYGY